MPIPLTLDAALGDLLHAGSGIVTLLNAPSGSLALTAVDTIGAIRVSTAIAPQTLSARGHLTVPLAWTPASVVHPALIVRGSGGPWVLDLPGATGSDLGASPNDDPGFAKAAADAYEHECCSSAPPPVVTVPGGTLGGRADDHTLGKAITAQLTEIRYCYSRELAHDHALAGEVVYTFTIGTRGQVTALHLDSTSFSHGTVESCIAGLLSHITFPAASSDAGITATYPFAFTPS